jgi:hypothetical protein
MLRILHRNATTPAKRNARVSRTQFSQDMRVEKDCSVSWMVGGLDAPGRRGSPPRAPRARAAGTPVEETQGQPREREANSSQLTRMATRGSGPWQKKQGTKRTARLGAQTYFAEAEQELVERHRRCNGHRNSVSNGVGSATRSATDFSSPGQKI